ncbi:MAG: chorismate mutase [Gemmobacter sp.]|nr:chorismate mutase [Gemmobacter sp.]
MKQAAECNSMTELREVIDALDARIIALLAERAGCIDRAAELKPAEGLPARIDARVEQVVDNARRVARQHGLDPALVETLWRTMIEWSIVREEQTLGQGIPQKDKT